MNPKATHRLRRIYIRAKVKAKAIIFFDLLPLTHHCSINTQIGDNVTDRKRRRFRVRFRSNINAPLDTPSVSVTSCDNKLIDLRAEDLSAEENPQFHV